MSAAECGGMHCKPVPNGEFYLRFVPESRFAKYFNM
jgi:hypothetical protein